MVYANRQEAKDAQAKFYEELDALETKYGITFEIDDCSVDCWYTVEYKNESGKVDILY